MIRMMCLCLAAVLCLCGVPALGESTDTVIKAQCPDDFTVQSIDMSKDGTILLAGAVGNIFTDSAPLLMGVNVQGEVLWTIDGERQRGVGSNFFRTAKYLEDSSIVALQTWGKPGTGWMMQFYRDGELDHEILEDGDIFGIYPVADGFFTYNSPELYDSQITKLNMDGSGNWDKLFEDDIHFEGILSSGKTHVGFGNKWVRDGDVDSGPFSVVLALDEHGNKTIWRHENGTDSEKFLAGTMTEDGRAVLAGYVSGGPTPPKAGDKDRGAFLAEYGEAGQLWRTYYLYEQDGFFGAVLNIAILPVPEGYLCALNGSERMNSIRMLLIDVDGNLQKEWDESKGDLLGVDEMSLYQVSGKIYLIASGNMENPADVDALEEAGERIPHAPRSTIINEVEIPA